MKLGAIHLWGEDTAAYRRLLRLCHALGYDTIGVGDSPAGWRDMGLSLAIAAEEAPGVKLATMVTTPFMRHPLVTANMLATLNGLNGCESALGFATGGSTILAIGHPPATIAETRDHVLALRALLDGEAVEWDGTPVKPLRFPSAVPILLSAFGPRALDLAGEVADGAILFTGDSEEHLTALAARIATVRASARAHGRDPDRLIFWVVSFTAIRATRQEALNDLLAFIAVNGMTIRTPEAIAQVPGQFKDKLRQLHERYDPGEHVVPGGKNVALMRELGLSEYLGDFDTLAGPPEHVKTVIDRLEALGVDTFFMPLPGHEDPEPTVRALAQIFGKVPVDR